MPYHILSVNNIALAIIQNVQKLAGERTFFEIMVTPTGIVGVFLSSKNRFPASTLNVGQRERPRFMSVLVGTFVYWLDAL